MNNKNIFLYVIVSFIIFSCSQQETPSLSSLSFNKDAYIKKVEAAFFSDSAQKKLRFLRNEIYARHGRMFESKDLRDHFAQCDWYRPIQHYSDTMLSKSETEMVRRIIACETYLQKPDDGARRRLDSLRVFYTSNSSFDTSIVDFIDYTGDGKKEECITAISRRGDLVEVHHVIINGKDTIYNKTEPASFAPEKDMVPVYGVFNNLKTAVRLSPFKASLKSVSPDVKKHYEGNKAYKKYLAKFKGEVLMTITGESAGCCYFWYAPEKKFETLYCE
jgi:hypothetical protein